MDFLQPYGSRQRAILRDYQDRQWRETREDHAAQLETFEDAYARVKEQRKPGHCTVLSFFGQTIDDQQRHVGTSSVCWFSKEPVSLGRRRPPIPGNGHLSYIAERYGWLETEEDVKCRILRVFDEDGTDITDRTLKEIVKLYE